MTSLIKRLLSSLGLGRPAQPKSLPSALFPTQDYSASVSDWARSIQDLPESQNWRLARIVHCKATWSLRHEFVLIYVRHPFGKGKKVVILVEPLFGHDGDEMHTPGTTPHRDRVRLSAGGTKPALTGHGHDEVCTIKFPKASEAPSVAHLAALLTVLDRHALSPSPSAELRSRWLAYCVTEVLRVIFGGSVRVKHGLAREEYGGLRVEARDTIDALIREYKPVWDVYLRQMTRGTALQPAKSAKSTHKTEKEVDRKAQMDSFADMLRTINV